MTDIVHALQITSIDVPREFNLDKYVEFCSIPKNGYESTLKYQSKGRYELIKRRYHHIGGYIITGMSDTEFEQFYQVLRFSVCIFGVSKRVLPINEAVKWIDQWLAITGNESPINIGIRRNEGTSK